MEETKADDRADSVSANTILSQLPVPWKNSPGAVFAIGDFQ